MLSVDFYQQLEEKIKNFPEFLIEKHILTYPTGNYYFLKIKPKQFGPQDRFLLVRAGVHGEEISGPLTLLKNFYEIAQAATRLKIKLLLYPLGNPSGFEKKQRFSVGNEKGYLMCNDFVRYELENGTLVDDLKDKNIFRHWYWSSDKKIGARLTPETKLMHQLIKDDPLGQIVAVLDLHQDYLTPNVGSAAYHYAFGDLSAYRNIIDQIKKELPLLTETKIAAGENGGLKSDESGFIVRHDGTLPDLFWRLGAKYCVTAETTGQTPLDKAIKINLIWIYGLLTLIKKHESSHLPTT
ncbi:MAG: hypothetical protein COU85_00120 [Candidatus Portnoybacteria bacterium CG10_big_fil_rev_8_21_14_0_10_44_7]|uniref:Succinylglutamate desuccinylase/Aspartoacylase catalytic domain-containing protein n=1 Tax=Candidatus Portnoybacteria bacterium CG10_big_fil_rev_8_21_14_0_10_44_7 TaxID=1974816 RepID=A0A2M8KJK4_9BACT|nr:MAG: hypothetical protein COU85_00120 [Candidatus Portnoybacteria bacterium CG10_big_fil_rev_8_21_14_0_10_44_7]